jgi:hypothetical protein
MKNTKDYNKNYYESHKKENHLSIVECDNCGKCVCLLSLKKHQLSTKCQFQALKNKMIKEEEKEEK